MALFMYRFTHKWKLKLLAAMKNTSSNEMSTSKSFSCNEWRQHGRV
jgi:hypothetical protein